MTDGITSQEIKNANPISECINNFIHSLKDAEEAALMFIPLAIKLHNRKLKQAQRDLEKGEEISSEENDPRTQVGGLKLISSSLREFERIANANVPELLEKALFLNIFSDFDAFTGKLLLSLYQKNPKLLNSINKSIPLSDVLNYSDLNDLKGKVLNEEIESFRRKSYVEQFEDLEKRFGVKLTKFDRWSEFVEATQRRNIFMHCDGEVSDQYLKICQKHKSNVSRDIQVGDQIEFDGDYIFNILDLMSEVSVKLAHVLWRKLIPDEISVSDEHLSEVIYDYLKEEEWIRAAELADFALALPSISSDVIRKINTINAVIAYKSSGQVEHAMNLLDSTDWSASINDFRLAEAVLKDDLDRAESLMLRIGKTGELIKEPAYHDWPLFNDFRETENFLRAYESVYGYTFLSEMKRSYEEKVLEVDGELDE